MKGPKRNRWQRLSFNGPWVSPLWLILALLLPLMTLHSKESTSPKKSPRILMIVTSASKMPNGEPTGLWLEEFAVPYEIFKAANAVITVASPGGGSTPIDPRSKPSMENEARWQDASERLSKTVPPTVEAKDFEAVFLPGGHMFDFPANAELMRLLRDFDAAPKPIAAVCHAPAALVTAVDSAGAPLVQDCDGLYRFGRTLRQAGRSGSLPSGEAPPSELQSRPRLPTSH